MDCSEQKISHEYGNIQFLKYKINFLEERLLHYKEMLEEQRSITLHFRNVLEDIMQIIKAQR